MVFARYWFLFICTLLTPVSLHASVTEGSIESTYKYAHVCHDESCATYGILNFKPTITASTSGAVAIRVTDAGITGHAWGDEVGWVNFTPTGTGVTINATTGAVGGTAYANTGGWLNFSPSSVSGGPTVGVTINSDGEFEGWAWLSDAYGGWIKFDCAESTTCVKTDWRPIPYRPTGGTQSGSKATPTTTTSASSTPPTSTSIEIERHNDVPLLIIPTTAPALDTPSSTVESESAPEVEQLTQEDVDSGNGTHVKGRTLYRRIFLLNPGGIGEITETNPECVVCLVVRMTQSASGTLSVLKWNFIPDTLELKIPISESLNIDAISLAVTGVVSYALIHVIVVGILRLMVL